MPIYEYECRECGHHVDKLQKLSDAPLVDCPACHAPALQKLISPAAFHLKGTGWYATDFKDSGKKPKDDKGDKDSQGKTKDQGKTGNAKADTKKAADDKPKDTN